MKDLECLLEEEGPGALSDVVVAVPVDPEEVVVVVGVLIGEGRWFEEEEEA